MYFGRLHSLFVVVVVAAAADLSLPPKSHSIANYMNGHMQNAYQDY